MSEAAVIFDGVWKKFRRGERNDSLRDLLPSLARRVFRRRVSHDLERENEFWGLRDVSFAVEPGQALGIIGPNGAGKSTSLKLLTRILKPTRGSCQVRGRVGALIEVAAGFHPDLTGRENVFLQGAIMGMRRSEIAKKFDDIVDFSGISVFIDTPVKRYSSGMQARLGFSLAAHLNPDVLFIDEVLSVGDLNFQTRCLEKLRQQSGAGVTLVFVSHNLQAVSMLCRRTLVIAAGQAVFDGPTSQAFDVYLRASQSAQQREGHAAPTFQLRSVSLGQLDGSPLGVLAPHAWCRFDATFECMKHVESCCVGFQIERTSDLLYCYGTTTQDLGEPLVSCRAGELLKISFAFAAHFARGHYRINLNVYDSSLGSFLARCDNVAQFVISELTTYAGVVDIEASASVVSQAGSKDSRIAGGGEVLTATVVQVAAADEVTVINRHAQPLFADATSKSAHERQELGHDDAN